METLREYRLLEKIGEGGMGSVYKAVHTKLNKSVAVKVLPPERMQDAAAVARFEREMLAVGQLDHPNIVRATDAGEHQGTYFLVMELVAGMNLAELVSRCGPLPVAEACELIRQAAVGLEHAHQHGMVHRDIKPSNLMLTPAGQVKILDLGLARLQSSQELISHELTASGQLMGTIDYMAPEQGGASHGVDIRADVYSLGATLYKLLCGRAPFEGPEYDSVVKKIAALATAPAPPLIERKPELPQALTRIVDRMLAKQPDERPATPAKLMEELAPFADGHDLASLLRQAGGEAKPGTTTVSPTASTAQVTMAAATQAVAKTPVGHVGVAPNCSEVASVKSSAAAAAATDERKKKKRRLLLFCIGGLIGAALAVVLLRPERSAGPSADKPPPAQGDLRGRIHVTAHKIESLAVSPDGSLVAVVDSSHEVVKIWNVTTGELVKVIQEGHSKGVKRVAISADGTKLATGGLEIVLWDLNTFRELAATEPSKYTTDLAFSPDSQLLVWCGYDEKIKVFNSSDLMMENSWTTDASIVMQVCFASDGGSLFSIANDHRVKQWDFSGQELNNFDGKSDCFAISPDGKMLATGGTSTGIKLLDLASGNELGTLAQDTYKVNDLVFSATSTQLAAALDDQIALWDVVVNKEVKKFNDGHEGAILQVAITSQGQSLVTGGADGVVAIWNLGEDAQPRTLPMSD